MLFYSFLSAAVLNGILAIQMGIYWETKVTKKEKDEDRLMSGTREKNVGLERVEVEKMSAVDARPASPPAGAKRHVRKLD